MGLRVDHVHPEELLASTQARRWEAVEGDADHAARGSSSLCEDDPRATDKRLRGNRRVTADASYEHEVTRVVTIVLHM